MTSAVATKVSLMDFAAAQKGPGPVCWLDDKPFKEEIEQARSAKVSWTVILKWLMEVHPESAPTRSRLENHFNARFHS
jgi:hypothetical protein